MHLASLRSARIALPPGRMITSDEGHGSRQPLWLGDEPPSPDLWGRICGAHADSGLWPLLLLPLDGDDGFRPWATGELRPEDMSSPEDHDAELVLAAWWRRHWEDDEEDLSPEIRLALTAPYGADWPGLAPAPGDSSDADVMAAAYAEVFAEEYPQARLGLVEAPRSADALAAVGWQGPRDHDGDTAKHAAVLRSWEDRFHARVVAVGSGTLFLSVAAPPTTRDEALAVAAEHLAFSPAAPWQHTDHLTAYAEQLIDVNNWEFDWA
ncbi:DUF4253 domain-containing protein [Streptomyces avicenniae]|uniref:DUF4253 domain-containing protein n=1 Tax=Streptomyces avicenniae TaxID=500153 RepID=UPI000B10FAA3|nr:DUF4253 domain-containing protein [Streptomyces avicenniae]